MFGISIYEFLVVLFVAIMVVPVRHWPDVARFLAKCVRNIRALIWKITDAGEQIKDRIGREIPITDIVQKTTDDVVAMFSEPIKKKKIVKKKK